MRRIRGQRDLGSPQFEDVIGLKRNSSLERLNGARQKCRNAVEINFTVVWYDELVVVGFIGFRFFIAPGFGIG